MRKGVFLRLFFFFFFFVFRRLGSKTFWVFRRDLRPSLAFPSPTKGRGVVPVRPSIFTFTLPLSFFLSSFFFFDRFLFCFFSPSFFTRFVALLSGCSIRFRFVDDRGGRIS